MKKQNKKTESKNEIKKLVDVSQLELDLDEWKRYSNEEVKKIGAEWVQVIFVDDDICFIPMVGGINNYGLGTV